MLSNMKFAGGRRRLRMAILQLLIIWAVCFFQVASAGLWWSTNRNASRAMQAEGATICSNTGRECCNIGFLTPTYTKSQYIMGVAADCSRSTVYISEAGGLRALEAGGREKWFAPSSGAWGVAVDSSNGNVFVSQYGAGVVQAYNPSGTLVRTIGSTLRGQSGKLGNFYGPTGVAVFRGNLIVADADNNRFQILGTDGAFRGVFGSQGYGEGQFGGSKIGPFGVSVHEASSRLYLADPYLNRISVWSLSGSEARFERHVGGNGGREVGQLFYPFGVSVQQDSGDIYVLNTNNHRVEVFDSNGGFRRSLGGGQSLKMCNVAARGDTLFPLSARPSLEERSRYDGKLMTVGVQFTAKVAGVLSGVRYIKPTGDRLGHRVVVYDEGLAIVYEQLLAADSCEAGDWVSLSFNAGVSLNAGQRYMLALSGLESYSATSAGFTPARGQSGGGGGIELDSNRAGAYLSNGQWSFSHTNYWIDVDFVAASAYSPDLNSPRPFVFPYAGAFGLDGNFYVGQGTPEAMAGAGCDTWPPADYSTIFSPGDTAAIRELNDGELLAMGVQFSTNTPGTITAVRFYKAFGEVGYGHVGKIYDFKSGKLLASTSDFSDEGCAGPAWVSASLATPLRTSPGTVYLAAVDNVYSFTKSMGGLENDRDRGPLKLLRNGALYAKAGRMPHIGGWGPHNYWVDVEFTTNTNVQAPPPLSTRRPTSSVDVVVSGGTPAPSLSVATTPRPTTGSQGRPTPSVSQGPLACNFWPSQGSTFFSESEQPALDSATSGSQHTLGIRLRTSVAGELTAVRYLKSRAEDGSRHNVRILDWDTGELYASVTNVDDAACQGPTWVSVALSSPLRTRVGATYLVYVDNVLFFSRSDGFYTGPLTRGPLTILGSSTGSAGFVPWDTFWQATNYWIDVEFSPPGTSPSPRVPAPVPTSPPSSPPVPAPVPLVPPTTPARSPVPPTGGSTNTGSSGGGSGGYGCNVWPASGTQTLFSADDQPLVSDSSDGSRHAFGLRLKTAVAGELTAVRFLKASGESGANVRVRIIDWVTEKEYASPTPSDAAKCGGQSWVSVPLNPRVRTTVGTTYLVYVDGISTFPRSDGFFQGPVTKGALQAVGASSGHAGFVPWDTFWQATNYWIDVEFVPSGTVVGPPLPAPVPAPLPANRPAPVPPPTSRSPSRSPSPKPQSPGSVVTALCNTWPRPPFQTLFAASDLPSLTPQTERQPQALGVIFSSREDGDIAAVRWFKAAGEGGSGHVGRIYDWDTGRQLATTVPFSDTSCAGPRWVSARLSKPLAIRADVEYVVVMDNVRSFSRSEWVLHEDWYSSDLRAHQGGTLSGDPGTMPRNRGFAESCYWVDVEFIANVDKPASSKSLSSMAGASASMGPPVAVACNTWPQGPGTVTFFTPRDATPAVGWGDGRPYAVGVRVQPRVAGQLRAVRFFRAPREPMWGHSFRVLRWKDGKLLAVVANVDHSSCQGSGWVSVALDPPVVTSVGEEYVVVVDQLLHLARTDHYFPRPSTRGQLTLLAATSGPAGADPFGLEWATSNFWIDVEFAPAALAAQALPVRSQCGPWPGPDLQTIFTTHDRPHSLDRHEGRSIAVGIRVSVSVPGMAVAVRFYKSPREGGEGHTGMIYDWASGALLASTVADLKDLQCPGPQWVSLPLDQALPLYPGTQYVVAVDSVTNYAKSDDSLTSDRVSRAGQLTGRRNGAVFGSPGSMPRNTSRAASNFWVDLEFEPTP